MTYKAKHYYQDKEIADRYYQKRFSSFPGQFNHFLEKTFLINTIQDLKIESVLDVACGTGRMTRELLNCEIKHITGIDISEEMIDVARKYCSNENINIVFQKGDATHLPITNNEYDLVISYRFLDHLPPVEKKQALAEMLRVSKKYLVFTMANLNGWTRFARYLRKTVNKNYYEGFLIDEKEVLQLMKKNNVNVLKRKMKTPLLAMEIMYFCKKN